jgi:hypothetical protein
LLHFTRKVAVFVRSGKPSDPAKNFVVIIKDDKIKDGKVYKNTVSR